MRGNTTYKRLHVYLFCFSAWVVGSCVSFAIELICWVSTRAEAGEGRYIITTLLSASFSWIIRQGHSLQPFVFRRQRPAPRAKTRTQPTVPDRVRGLQSKARSSYNWETALEMPANARGPFLVNCPVSSDDHEELVSISGNRPAHGAWASAFRMACGLNDDGSYTRVMLPMRLPISEVRPLPMTRMDMEGAKAALRAAIVAATESHFDGSYCIAYGVDASARPDRVHFGMHPYILSAHGPTASPSFRVEQIAQSPNHEYDPLGLGVCTGSELSVSIGVLDPNCAFRTGPGSSDSKLAEAYALSTALALSPIEIGDNPIFLIDSTEFISSIEADSTCGPFSVVTSLIFNQMRLYDSVTLVHHKARGLIGRTACSRSGWFPDRISKGTYAARTNLSIPAPSPDFVNGFALQYPEQCCMDFEIQICRNASGNTVFASFRNVSTSSAPIVPLWKFLHNPRTPDFPFAWSWADLLQVPWNPRVGPLSYLNRFFDRRPMFMLQCGLPEGENNWYHSDANTAGCQTVRRWATGPRANAARPVHRNMPDVLIHFRVVV